MRETLQRSTMLGVAGLVVLAVVESVSFAGAVVVGVRPTAGVGKPRTAVAASTATGVA